MQTTLEGMEIGPLFTIFLGSFIVQLMFQIMAIIIYVIVYGRMIEIYLTISLAPIPFATFGNREQSMMGQNYLKSLFALGFQGFMIMVCIGIYAILIHEVMFTSDIMGSLWRAVAITFLLAFMLFKSGSIAKAVLQGH